MNKIAMRSIKMIGKHFAISSTIHYLSLNQVIRTAQKRLFHLTIVCGLIVTTACEKTDPDLPAGEAIVNQTCKACHAGGLNNAPILGNKKMWEPRAAQGLDTLVEHAINGFELMPAKGGNDTLTDEEIRQAIKYMLSLLEK